MLKTDQLREVLERIKSHFKITHGAEITLELDPGTFDLRKLDELQEMGFNRFSTGI